MRLLPRGRVEAVRVAIPLAIVELPNTVEPLVNITVPVTFIGRVSVKVTALPGSDGLLEDVSVATVSALFTIWVAVPTAEL
jgi:hypothetical protein